MSPRSLFIVILRVIGIIFLKELLVAVPQLISSVLVFFTRYSPSDGIFMVFISLLTVILYLWISFNLIFKAERLVARFALDKGFSEESFQLSVSIPSILHIALILTGTVILLTNIPDFCAIVWGLSTGQDASYLSTGNRDWTPAVFSAVKIILGLLIIGERRRILEFLQTSPGTNESDGPANPG